MLLDINVLDFNLDNVACLEELGGVLDVLIAHPQSLLLREKGDRASSRWMRSCIRLIQIIDKGDDCFALNMGPLRMKVLIYL